MLAKTLIPGQPPFSKINSHIIKTSKSEGLQMSHRGLFFAFIKNIYMKVSAVLKPFQTEAKVNVWEKKKESFFLSI